MVDVHYGHASDNHHCSFDCYSLHMSKQHMRSKQGPRCPVMQVLHLQLLRLQAAGLVRTSSASATATCKLEHWHLQDYEKGALRDACMQDLWHCRSSSVCAILLCSELEWLCSFRQILEPLLYKYGVDLVYNGHVSDLLLLVLSTT